VIAYNNNNNNNQTRYICDSFFSARADL